MFPINFLLSLDETSTPPSVHKLLFIVQVLLFPQALKFFNCGILITTTMMTLICDLTFATQRQEIFVLLYILVFGF